MSEKPAKTASKTPHSGDGGVIAENAANEAANEDAGTDNPVSEKDTEHATSEMGGRSAEREPSAERTPVETTAGPATEGSKVEPKTKTDASSRAGGKAAPRLAAREDSSPGNTGRIIELVVFAVIIAVVVMVGAAMFNATHGSLPKDKQTYGGDDLLGTAIYRRLRSWHGYGPQLLVCTLGERRSVVAPESLPPDGLCDVVLYAHVMSLGSEFHDGASANLRALWTRSATAVNTRFGYSLSDSLLPIDERELEAFVRRAVDDKKIGAFGMLDARWDRDAKNNESYATFVEALNRTTKLLPTDRRAALVFGFRVNPDTSARGVEFLNSHAAILDHVHVLVYQGHVELPPQNDSAKSECAVRFPSPRFQQAKDSDQTMQDGVAAIDTALHFRKDRLATDICVSVALSGLRYSLTRAARENKELEAKCANATAVPYADVCPSNGTSGGVKISGEGVLVTGKPQLVLDVFDDSETLAQKLRTAKLALSLSAQPHWSFCLAAFNVEHEDSDGACGESFERLTVARSFLHGKLRWHDD
ncbi:hypothetical protein HPB52_004627 [Rhipicephalus sanguineus]|uniref:Uncharacterized protein n=1 Tax=Rhipicephalus sanguineus TaxID=34632 RepID=A0A9D4SNN3_RHISA|nr:hypothetical protein HPB52_004627 [Rhipicephalus sanguineus]